ncbi:hypothetical protein [Chryseobacterium sp. FH2]|uniref:hypothetical protein n=1 Tax=Chryseobacterium sp. FH2 TaxID=1674291 RepID=UPI000AB7392E|nr:hypothetical protein [Chryseobacterium sp. FH2]
MKKTLYFITLLLLASCYTSQYFTKQTKMRHFDIEKFKKNAIGKYSLNYEYEQFGTITKQTGAKLKSGTVYQENISKKHSTLEDWYEYDEKGRLRKTGSMIFHDNPIGFYREYDENGKMILEENEEEKYKLSYTDIREIILKTEGRDIFDNRQNTLVIREFVQFAYYMVFISYDDKPTKKYLLDASTGEKVDFSKIKKTESKSTSHLKSPNEIGTAYSSNNELTADKNIYPVYDGRYYTKAEWEEFQKSLPWWKRIL